MFFIAKAERENEGKGRLQKKIREKFGKLGGLTPPYSAATATSFKLHTSIDSSEYVRGEVGSLCDQLPTRSPLSTADIFLGGGGRGRGRGRVVNMVRYPLPHIPRRILGQ